MDEPFYMLHDDGLCGCNIGPEQEGHSKREEETISWFHCDSSISALKPGPKPAKSCGCVVPLRHVRDNNSCLAARPQRTIAL